MFFSQSQHGLARRRRQAETQPRQMIPAIIPLLGDASVCAQEVRTDPFYEKTCFGVDSKQFCPDPQLPVTPPENLLFV